MKKLSISMLLFIIYPATLMASIGQGDFNAISRLTPEENLYWGIHLGKVKTDSVSHKRHFVGNTQQSEEISFSSGFNVGFKIGYQSGPYRFEGIASYWDSHHKDFKQNGVLTNGENKTMVYAAMFNAYYDFLDQHDFPITPFIGAGVGAANIDTKITGNVLNDKPETKFAYNGMFGLALKASDDMNIEIGYKHFKTAKAKKALIEQSYLANAIELGIRYNF